MRTLRARDSAMSAGIPSQGDRRPASRIGAPGERELGEVAAVDAKNEGKRVRNVECPTKRK